MKNASGGPENIYISLPGPFRVRASSLSTLVQVSFVFPLYSENAPNTLKMALART